MAIGLELALLLVDLAALVVLAAPVGLDPAVLLGLLPAIVDLTALALREVARLDSTVAAAALIPLALATLRAPLGILALIAVVATERGEVGLLATGLEPVALQPVVVGTGRPIGLLFSGCSDGCTWVASDVRAPVLTST